MSLLFQFGLGYTTAGVAREAQQQKQWRVVSTARRPDRYNGLVSEQHRVVAFDPAGGQLLCADGTEALLQSRYVLTSIPPIASKLYDPVLRAQLKCIRAACSSSSCQIQGLGYLSSTGVYGDWQGDWVDESCEPRTATSRGVVRLEAEQAWAALAEQVGVPLTIFRLGGIYGPRRSVLHNLKAEVQPGSSAARRGRQRFTSRCHAADVVAAVLADAHRRGQEQQQQQQHGRCTPGMPAEVAIASRQQAGAESSQSSSSRLVEIINVVDDEPAPRAEVEAYARALLAGGAAAATTLCESPGDKRPGTAAAGQPGRRVSGRAEPLEEKRVRNDRLKGVLRVDLKAPSYRQGLDMLHAGDDQPFARADLDCLYGP